MATRRYGANPGFSLENVVEAVGAPTVANSVELTVDLSNAIVNDNYSTRTMSKQELLLLLTVFQEYIVRSIWPPA